MAHLQKVSGRPQTARCWEMRRFSRSILVSPMRSSAEKRSQSITVTVSVWSYTAAVERECFMYSHKVRGSIITHVHNTYSRSTIINGVTECCNAPADSYPFLACQLCNNNYYDKD